MCFVSSINFVQVVEYINIMCSFIKKYPENSNTSEFLNETYHAKTRRMGYYMLQLHNTI